MVSLGRYSRLVFPLESRARKTLGSNNKQWSAWARIFPQFETDACCRLRPVFSEAPTSDLLEVRAGSRLAPMTSSPTWETRGRTHFRTAQVYAPGTPWARGTDINQGPVSLRVWEPAGMPSVARPAEGPPRTRVIAHLRMLLAEPDEPAFPNAESRAGRCGADSWCAIW